MDIEFKKRISIEFAIIAAILLVLFGGTIALGFDMKRRSSSIISLYDQINLERQSVNSLVALRSEAEKARPYSDLLNTLLPSQNALIAFPKYFRDTASLEGLKTSFVFGAESEGSESVLGFIRFEASLTGSPDSMLMFLQKLKQGSYLVSIDSIDLSVKGNNSVAEIGGKIFSR